MRSMICANAVERRIMMIVQKVSGLFEARK